MNSRAPRAQVQRTKAKDLGTSVSTTPASELPSLIVLQLAPGPGLLQKWGGAAAGTTMSRECWGLSRGKTAATTSAYPINAHDSGDPSSPPFAYLRLCTRPHSPRAAPSSSKSSPAHASSMTTTTSRKVDTCSVSLPPPALLPPALALARSRFREADGGKGGSPLLAAGSCSWIPSHLSPSAQAKGVLCAQLDASAPRSSGPGSGEEEEAGAGAGIGSVCWCSRRSRNWASLPILQ